MREDDPLKHTPMCEHDRDNRVMNVTEVYNALGRSLSALVEENERLRTQCGGNCRYWEGRWRDEAKENERLKEALTNALLALDERKAENRLAHQREGSDDL